MVVRDRMDYLGEGKSQFSDKEVYWKLKNDAERRLVKVIKSVIRKIRDRGDISDETLDCFLVNNPKLSRFY